MINLANIFEAKLIPIKLGAKQGKPQSTFVSPS